MVDDTAPIKPAKTNKAQTRILGAINRDADATAHHQTLRALRVEGCILPSIAGRHGHVLTQRGRNALPPPKGKGVIDPAVPADRQVYFPRERELWEMRLGDTIPGRDHRTILDYGYAAWDTYVGHVSYTFFFDPTMRPQQGGAVTLTSTELRRLLHESRAYLPDKMSPEEFMEQARGSLGMEYEEGDNFPGLLHAIKQTHELVGHHLDTIGEQKALIKVQEDQIKALQEQINALAKQVEELEW